MVEQDWIVLPYFDIKHDSLNCLVQSLGKIYFHLNPCIVESGRTVSYFVFCESLQIKFKLASSNVIRNPEPDCGLQSFGLYGIIGIIRIYN